MHERIMDKSHPPTEEEMVAAIGQPLATSWAELRRFLVETYKVVPVFNSGGKKYGWNLQYRSGSRPLCEMYPESGSFTTLVILGKAELDQAMQRLDSFGVTVQNSLKGSPRYHDGCWMYIRLSDPQTCFQDARDIEKLILIKKKPLRK